MALAEQSMLGQFLALGIIHNSIKTCYRRAQEVWNRLCLDEAAGGLRHPNTDSHNMGWRNFSFRGFADYMQTREFDMAIDDLLGVSEDEATTIMCAEIPPWRCHRF